MASASSSFTGTEAPLSEGGVWTALSAYWQNMRKANGAAVNSSLLGNDCAMRYTGATFAADHYSEITLAAVPTAGVQLFFQYVMVRMNSTAACYLATTAPDVSTTTLQLYKLDNAGAYTQIGANITLGAAMAAGDVMRLEVVGTGLTVKYNGSTVRTVTDSTIATGQPAIGGWAQNGASDVPLISSWSAADIGGTASGAGSSSGTSTASGVGAATAAAAGSSAGSSTVSGAGAATAAGAGSSSGSGTASGVSLTGSIFPLTVAPNGRYLRQNDGTPFPICANSTWSLAVNLPIADLSSFLSTVTGQGFNTLMFNAIEHNFTVVKPPKERGGLLPFTQRLNGTTYTGSPNGTGAASGTQGQFAADNYSSISTQAPDPTFVNTTYWQAIETVLDALLAQNILVFVWPAYLGFHAGQEGWMAEMVAWDAVTGAGGFTGQGFADPTKSKMWNYGAWLADRWKTYPNIIWMAGGDYGANSQTLNTAQRNAVTNFVAGMKSVSGQLSTLWSAHWDRPAISTDTTISGVSWDLNFCYSDEASAELTRRAFAASPAVPAVFGEGYYEDTTIGGSAPWRQYLWWGFLGGIAGGFFGNEPLWRVDTDYATHMNTQGAQDAARQFAFWKSRPWHRLKPSGLDAIGTLITAGGGTASPQSSTYVAAAATPEGDLLLAYVPPAHTGSVTVDMTKLSATVVARWFDPTNASYTSIGTFPNTGTHAFSTPGNNSDGDADWLLVLETVAGSAAGTSTASGVGAATAAAAGSSSGSSLASGGGAATAAGTGSAAGTSTATGTSDTAQSGAGSSSGSSTASGVGAATAAAAGSAGGSGAAAGGGAATASAAGSASGSSTATGVGASFAAGTGAGMAAGSSTASGGGAAIAAGAGSSVGTSTVIGASIATDPISAAEDAIYAWVHEGSGLAGDHVIWSDLGPIPAGTYIAMRLKGSRTVSDDWITPRKTDDDQIVYHIRGTRHPTLELTCFAGATTGALRCEWILNRVIAMASDPDIRSNLNESGVGLGAFGPIRTMDGMRSQMFDPRAIVEIPLHMGIDLARPGAAIEHVELGVTINGGPELPSNVDKP